MFAQGCAVYTGFTAPENFSNNHLTLVLAYLIFFIKLVEFVFTAIPAITISWAID